MTAQRPKASGAVETREQRACPLCGSGSTRIWRRRGRDRQQGVVDQEFDYSRCRSCGVRYLVQRPLESELPKLYPDGYRPYAGVAGPPRRGSRPSLGKLLRGLGAGLDIVFPSPLDRELESFYSAGAGGLLLDFGCGSPAFLDEARAGGWQTLGADFSPGVVERVGTAGHVGFLVGEELERGVADGSLARVRMNHVLEHLPEPRGALSQLHRKLAAGGRIHIATPNPRSVGCVLFRARWFGLDCPRHLLLYPPRLAAALLREAGFRRTRIVHQAASKDIVRSFDFVLHDLGRITREELDEFAADEARLEVMRLPAKLAAFLRASDRFHVFADA